MYQAIKRSAPFAGALLVIALAASCLATPAAQAPDHCRKIAEYPCLSGRVCVQDQANHCQVCRCASPAYEPPGTDLRPFVP